MWKSAPEISEQIKRIENVDRLTSTHALREFWQNAIYAEAYRADEAWSKLLILSTYGKQILGEHEGLLSRIPEPDLLLALFCMFNHHDLIVDWTQTNIEGIVTLLKRELLAEKLRLPYRYGRSLYDRFNDVH